MCVCPRPIYLNILLDIFTEPSVTQQIQSSRDAKALQENLIKHHDFKAEWVGTCYNYAKCLFEIDNYEDASEYMYFHLILCTPSDKNFELFLYQKQYLNAIQTTCPWILRYLSTAVVIKSSRRNVMLDLVKVIQEESYTYRDPITSFIEDLYVKFNFDSAQQKLRG